MKLVSIKCVLRFVFDLFYMVVAIPILTMSLNIIIIEVIIIEEGTFFLNSKEEI